MKTLPIGISSFSKIRQDNYYYVDKTQFIHKLVTNGTYYFLSRPRRFGKSLLIDTLKQAFLAEKQYFKGLYLETNWDWQTKYPVIHISFGGGVIKSREVFDKSIHALIIENARNYEISITEEVLHFQFKELIHKLHDKYQQRVVILIDEYDKPILDNITNKELAIQIREGLKNFYSVIKDCDQWLKFVFLTGVTKFSKVSLFSGLNNLTDMTLDSRYAEICGYTEKEIIEVFSDRLENVNFSLLKRWYNGYNFLGTPVYNPFDVLLYLDSKQFINYWFETATPSFLLKLIEQKKYFLPNLENIKTTENLLSSFDIERIELETILFQTGYLTITGTKKLGAKEIYELSYPNLEVQTSFTEFILNYLTTADLSSQENNKIALYESLCAADFETLEKTFNALFASIPYNWYVNNPMNEYEGYYASVFYCYLAALDVELIGEDTSNRDRIDLTVKIEDKIYIIEFKLKNQPMNALQQIKERRYFEKYQNEQAAIYLIGVEFNPEDKNIDSFEWEIMS